MAALPVVEDLDVFEERGLRPAPGSEPRAMHEFGLESAEEALHWGVVQAVPLSAHRGCDAICLEHLAVVAAGILNPAVGVVDQAPRWPPVPARHLQRILAQAALETVRHRPAGALPRGG